MKFYNIIPLPQSSNEGMATTSLPWLGAPLRHHLYMSSFQQAVIQLQGCLHTFLVSKLYIGTTFGQPVILVAEDCHPVDGPDVAKEVVFQLLHCCAVVNISHKHTSSVDIIHIINALLSDPGIGLVVPLDAGGVGYVLLLRTGGGVHLYILLGAQREDGRRLYLPFLIRVKMYYFFMLN